MKPRRYKSETNHPKLDEPDTDSEFAVSNVQIFPVTLGLTLAKSMRESYRVLVSTTLPPSSDETSTRTRTARWTGTSLAQSMLFSMVGVG